MIPDTPIISKISKVTYLEICVDELSMNFMETSLKGPVMFLSLNFILIVYIKFTSRYIG